MARTPSSRASVATDSASSTLDRALTTTSAPWRANSSTVARPILRPEPVTSATLPLRDLVSTDTVVYVLCSILSVHDVEVGPSSMAVCRKLMATTVARAVVIPIRDIKARGSTTCILFLAVRSVALNCFSVSLS